MTQPYRSLAVIVSASLILTVVTQIVYMATLSGVDIVEGWPLRSAIWTIELLLFTVIAVAGFAAMVRSSQMQLAWSAIAVSGLVNMLQAGIGLSMFLPASKAGEDFAPLMDTVLGGAFLFYFLAKILIGFAGISFGLALVRGGSTLPKAVGAIAAITGLVAVGLNLAALPQGLAIVFPAGASGTIATFFAGWAIWLNRHNEQNASD